MTSISQRPVGKVSDRLAILLAQAEAAPVVKRVAPVGKKIICETQRLQMYTDVVYERRSLDSTISSQKGDADLSQLSDLSAYSPGDGLTRQQALKKRIADGKKVWADEREALGGSHNIFTDAAPEFRPVLNHDPDSSDDEYRAVTPVPQTYGSQGRAGEGCSTPRAGNATFGMLRQIDVSAVVRLDDSSNPNREVVADTPRLYVGSSSKTEEHAGDDSEPEAMEVDQDNDDSIDMFRAPLDRKSMAVKKGGHDQSDRRMTFTIPSNSPAGGTFTVKKDSIASSTDDVNRTFTADNDALNGTFTVDGKNQETREGTFTVEEAQVKEKSSTNTIKRKVQNEDESKSVNTTMNVSRTSMRSMMGLDIESPGRALFANNMRKKANISNTPERYAQPIARPSVGEYSIAMSDISQQPSDMSNMDDESMVDPQTDPRSPMQLHCGTPKRAPGTTGRLPVTAMRAGTSKQPESSTAKGASPMWKLSQKKADASMGSPVTGLIVRLPQSVTGRSAERRQHLSQGVFERLYRSPSRTRCPKNVTQSPAEKTPIGKGDVVRASGASTPRPLGNFARPTFASIRRTEGRNGSIHTTPVNTPAKLSFDDSQCDIFNHTEEDIEESGGPMSPLLPHDPSRMLVDEPMQSGVRPRITSSRIQVQNRLHRTLFLDTAGREESDNLRRQNLAKRDVAERRIMPEENDDVFEADPVHARELDVPAAPATNEEMGDLQRSERGSLQSEADKDSNAADDLADAASHLSLSDDNGALHEDSGEYNGVYDDDEQPDRDNSVLVRKGKLMLTESMCSLNTPHRQKVPRRIVLSSESEDSYALPNRSMLSTDSISSIDSPVTVRRSMFVRARVNPDEPVYIAPLAVIAPQTPEQPELRRSTRNRMPPVRQWLGEKAVYKGTNENRRLVGSSAVVVTDSNMIRYGTSDPNVISGERQEHAARLRRSQAQRKKNAKEKREQLRDRHRKKQDLDITVDSIVTSGSDSD